ncbi:MAG: efflux RND transporter periplasmic adaptor subunit [Thermomonas sp.]|nr:efflux RND transporter periplasmic adaptor subunit [Thermomonas sp.]
MSKPSPKRPPNPTLRWVLMLAGVIVVFGGVFAVKAFFAKQTDNFFDNMPQPAVAVSSHVAKTQRWTEDGEAVGTFVAINGTDITTEAGGVIRSIEFEPGQQVSAGTVLVRLNTANEEATLNALETSAKLASVQAQRWQQLGKDKLVSLDDVQSRVTAAATAQAQVDAQRALIAQKTIRAPFSGVLGLRKVNLGQYVAPGAAIVSLQQLDPIYLDFSLPEQQAGKVVAGTAVRASVDALPGNTFDGRITAVEPQVDPAHAQFQGAGHLPEPAWRAASRQLRQGRIRPGRRARRAGDPADRGQLQPLRQRGVRDQQDRASRVRTDMQGQELTGDKLVVTQRFVKTGATRGDLVMVSEGLKAGEQVVTSGLLKLRNDAEVTINDAIQPSADANPAPENR